MIDSPSGDKKDPSGEKKDKKDNKDKKDQTEHHHHHDHEHHHHHDKSKTSADAKDPAKASGVHKHRHRDKTEKSSSAAPAPVVDNSAAKPTGPAPVPPLSMANRIVKELHSDPLPSPTTPTSPNSTKVTSPIKAVPLTEAAKVEPKVVASVENQGVIATLLHWVRENLFQPTFSRQKKISDAYSSHFSQTVKAIGKRFSANDPVQKDGIGKSLPLRFSVAKGTNDAKDEKAKTAVVDNVTAGATSKPTLH